MTRYKQDNRAEVEGEWRTALLKVIRDLRLRNAKQLRHGVPAEFTRNTLRYIRESGCRQEAQQAAQRIECAKWTSTDSSQLNKHTSFFSDSRVGPVSRTPDYVCDRCKHPVVTSSRFIDFLELAVDQEQFSDRMLRRYMSEANPTPVPIRQFRKAIANAFFLGWIGQMQALSIWQQADRLEAVQSGLRVILRRISERKKLLTAAELEQELEKQIRLIDRAVDAAIDKKLQGDELDPLIRDFLIHAFAERRALYVVSRSANKPIHGV